MRTIRIIFFVLVCLKANVQSLPKPGDNSINKNFIKSTHFEMAYFVVSGRQTVQISSYDVEMKTNDKNISVFTRIISPVRNSFWVDTSFRSQSDLPVCEYKHYDNSKVSNTRIKKEKIS